MSDVLVRYESVSKKFCRDLKRSLWYGVTDVVQDLLPVKNSRAGLSATEGLRRDEFWANKDITFELKRGECLGIIGGNGAGKTTLLKMLNGLIKPDAGRIEIRGSVGALIALGAGFNPILTGRENIYINGSVLGFSRREITKRADEIIEFAEISEFIDSPVKTYSSGMQVRLGFAIATALDPDVLIIDEVLAVGDAAFKVKCLNYLAERLPDCAVLFVSHNDFLVRRICNRALHLEKGVQKLLTDDVNAALLHYQSGNPAFNETRWIADGLDVLDYDMVFPWESSHDVRNGEFSFVIHNSGIQKRGRICVMLLNTADDHVFSYQTESIVFSPGTHIYRLSTPPDVEVYGDFRVNLLILGSDRRILARGIHLRQTQNGPLAISKSPIFQQAVLQACQPFC